MCMCTFDRKSTKSAICSDRMLQSSKMFQPKTLHEMIMPLLIANFVLGIGIWTTKCGRILSIAYSIVCLVIYCVLMKFSMEYMYLYFSHKASDFGVSIFRAIFYVNICFTLFLVPSGWLRRKVILRDDRVSESKFIKENF